LSAGRPPRSVRVPDLLVPSSEPATVDGPAARRRRRVVTAVTVVVGTALLAATLRVPHGSMWFTVLGLLVVAATWTVGSFVSGPIPFQPERKVAWPTVIGPVVAGVAAFGVFLAAYLVARHLPLVGAALDGVVATADAGSISGHLPVGRTGGYDA
jgi:CAAX protease family protein